MKSDLIIDDDLDIHVLLCTYLKNSYEVLRAMNGQEGLTLLENSTTLPDLIILDLEMPVMSGLAFKSKLKSYERLKNIPIIFLTANQLYADQIPENQGHSFLTKPIMKQDLLQTIEAHLKT